MEEQQLKLHLKLHLAVEGEEFFLKISPIYFPHFYNVLIVEELLNQLNILLHASLLYLYWKRFLM